MLVVLSFVIGLGMTQAIAAMQPGPPTAPEHSCGYGCPTTTTTSTIPGTTIPGTTIPGTTIPGTTIPGTTIPGTTTTTTLPVVLAQTGNDAGALVGLAVAGILFLDLGYLTISATWPGRRRRAD